MTDTIAWFALGDVTLTGVMGLVTAGLTHRWEERTRIAPGSQPIVSKRSAPSEISDREACHNYLVATNFYYQAIVQLHLKAGRGDEFDRTSM